MRIAICEDEKSQRELMKNYLRPYIEEYNIEINEFESGELLVQAYNNEHSFDIILIDIQMKELDGIQTIELIRRADTNAIVIFITSFVQYITEALRHNVFQFLVKPVKQDLFDYEFMRALNSYISMHAQFVIKTHEKIINLKIREILYIETQNRHLLLHTKKEKYQYNGILKNEYHKLCLHDFIFVHQAFVVNMACMKTIGKQEIILTNGEILPMSKRLKKLILSQFNIYMGRRCI